VASFNFSQLQRLWIDAGGSPQMAPVMAAIALAESGGCQYACHGPVDIRPVKECSYNYSTGENSIGLWQINVQAHPQYDAGSLFDPLANARAAVGVLGGGSPTPWSTYTNGAYQRYLSDTGAAPAGSVDTGSGSGSVGGQTIGLPLVGGVFSAVGDVFGKVFGGAWGLAKNIGSAVAGIAESIVFLVHFVTSPDNWLRLVEFLVGAGLIVFAIAVYVRLFSGSSGTAAAVTTAVTRGAV
jgi:hypothetical protein